MAVGLSQEELEKALMASEAEILKKLQLFAKDKTTVSAGEQSMALYLLLSEKIVEAMAANNQRIADQLATAGIAL